MTYINIQRGVIDWDRDETQSYCLTLNEVNENIKSYQDEQFNDIYKYDDEYKLKDVETITIELSPSELESLYYDLQRLLRK